MKKLVLLFFFIFVVKISLCYAEIIKPKELNEIVQNKFTVDSSDENLIVYFYYDLNEEHASFPTKKSHVYFCDTYDEINSIVNFNYTGKKGYSDNDFQGFDRWNWGTVNCDYNDIEDNFIETIVSNLDKQKYCVVIFLDDYSRAELVFDFTSDIIFKYTQVWLGSKKNIEEAIIDYNLNLLEQSTNELEKLTNELEQTIKDYNLNLSD